MKPSEFAAIMARLDTIEEKVDMLNPSKHVAFEKKTSIILAAARTGDKAKLKAAARAVNGR